MQNGDVVWCRSGIDDKSGKVDASIPVFEMGRWKMTVELQCKRCSGAVLGQEPQLLMDDHTDTGRCWAGPRMTNFGGGATNSLTKNLFICQ